MEENIDCLMHKGTAVVSSMKFRELYPRMPVLGVTAHTQTRREYISVRAIGRKTAIIWNIELWRPATISEVKTLFL
jgi:hypothetical protein